MIRKASGHARLECLQGALAFDDEELAKMVLRKGRGRERWQELVMMALRKFHDPLQIWEEFVSRKRENPLFNAWIDAKMGEYEVFIELEKIPEKERDVLLRLFDVEEVYREFILKHNKRLEERSKMKYEPYTFRKVNPKKSVPAEPAKEDPEIPELIPEPEIEIPWGVQIELELFSYLGGIDLKKKWGNKFGKKWGDWGWAEKVKDFIKR